MNMAINGYGGSYPYYQQPAARPYYYGYAQHPERAAGGGSRPPIQVFFVLATLLFLATASLYAWCEAAMESMLDKLRPLLILSPLLLIVVAQLWLAAGASDRRGGGGLGYLMSQMAPGEYYQRGAGPYGRWDGGGGGGGSSPWGVAVALVLVLMLLSYQSSVEEWRLFPLRRR
uniref:Uncharacterized protein n=1 Tax=Avena sativa TaxID=4498 RepID=A0ACD6APJ2_AVESA